MTYIDKILDDGKFGRSLRNSRQTERHLKTLETRINNIKIDKTVKDSNEALGVVEKLLKKV